MARSGSRRTVSMRPSRFGCALCWTHEPGTGSVPKWGPQLLDAVARQHTWGEQPRTCTGLLCCVQLREMRDIQQASPQEPGGWLAGLRGLPHLRHNAAAARLAAWHASSDRAAAEHSRAPRCPAQVTAPLAARRKASHHSLSPTHSCRLVAPARSESSQAAAARRASPPRCGPR